MELFENVVTGGGCFCGEGPGAAVALLDITPGSFFGISKIPRLERP
jgi:hypothetical protein